MQRRSLLACMVPCSAWRPRTCRAITTIERTTNKKMRYSGGTELDILLLVLSDTGIRNFMVRLCDNDSGDRYVHSKCVTFVLVRLCMMSGWWHQHSQTVPGRRPSSEMLQTIQHMHAILTVLQRPQTVHSKVFLKIERQHEVQTMNTD